LNQRNFAALISSAISRIRRSQLIDAGAVTKAALYFVFLGVRMFHREEIFDTIHKIYFSFPVSPGDSSTEFRPVVNPGYDCINHPNDHQTSTGMSHFT
jgi:hypothetical protein